MDKKLFQEILHRYNNGHASEQERAFIEAYYAGFEFRPDVLDQLSDAERERLGEIMYGGVEKQMSDMPRVGTSLHKLYFIRKWRLAASVTLLVASVVALVVLKQWFKPSKGSKGEGAVAILPGGDKAVLTLADGSRIRLDSAGNGALARQGAVQILKLTNGKIVYRLGDNGSKLSAGKDVLYNTMTTPRGGQYRLTLPDGTRVWLNAASSIVYPVVFTGGQRKVSISGEVYFEVTENRQKPFVVAVDENYFVKVLGTHFNVNAYPEEDNVRTMLLKGSVRISGNNGSFGKQNAYRGVILKPGDQAVGLSGLIVHPDPERVLAWKDGLFDFDNADLRTAMRQLERWYDIDVKFDGPVPDIRLEGKMDRGVQLEDVLVFFSKMKIKYRLEGRSLILFR